MSQASSPSSVSEAAPAAAATGRLKLSQVREIFRLVGEVRELGSDPQKWRPHMVQRLRDLLKANIVVSSEVHFRRNAKTGTMRVIDIGWVSDADAHTSQIHTEREDERPEAFWLTAGEPRKADDGEEDNGDELVPVTPTKKVYGGTTFVMSQVALPHAGAVDQLGLHREWGDDPFTGAQHRLVRIFHVELGRLWRRDVLRRAKEPNSDLPPRLSQTLEELLSGSSEKQIANKLELSRHTIHNYVKALHQRFGVSSRGELLAKAGQVMQDQGPKLSLSLPRKTGRKAAGEEDAAAGRRGR